MKPSRTLEIRPTVVCLDTPETVKILEIRRLDRPKSFKTFEIQSTFMCLDPPNGTTERYPHGTHHPVKIGHTILMRPYYFRVKFLVRGGGRGLLPISTGARSQGAGVRPAITSSQECVRENRRSVPSCRRGYALFLTHLRTICAPL